MIRSPRGASRVIRGTRSVVVAAAALALSAAPALSQQVWISEGPAGVPMTALAAAPSDPHRMYAGTASGAVWVSLDDGHDWTPAAGGLPAGPVRAIAVHPDDAAIVYAGTAEGVYRSDDAGGHWTARSNGMAPAAVLEIAIDPAVPDIVWAHTNEAGPLHVYRTTSGGAGWQSFIVQGPGFGTPTFGSIVGLSAHPQNGTIYAAWHEIVFYSSDGGDVWSRYSDVDHELLALLLDPFDPSVTYVGTFDAGCARSTAFGPWAFSPSLAGLRVEELAGDPLQPGVLYAATFDGRAFRSADRAAGFTELPRLPAAAEALLVTAGDGRLRVATPLGIYRLGSPSEVERMPVERAARPRGRPVGIDLRN